MNENGEEGFLPGLDQKKRLEEGTEVLARLKDATRQYLTALAGIVAYDHGIFKGTGTIIQNRGKVLLVTAAHVLDDIEKAVCQGVAFSNGDAKPYYRIAGVFTKDYSIDIAYARISNPTTLDSDRLPCPEHLIGDSRKAVATDLLFIHGFPGAYSRSFKMTGSIHSRTLPYGTTFGSPKWPEFNPNLHFALLYDPKYSVDGSGATIDLPDPHGLSGVAVWNTRRVELGQNWSPEDARIIGIVHRWDQDARCLIATRVENVLAFCGESDSKKGNG